MMDSDLNNPENAEVATEEWRVIYWKGKDFVGSKASAEIRTRSPKTFGEYVHVAWITPESPAQLELLALGLHTSVEYL